MTGEFLNGQLTITYFADSEGVMAKVDVPDDLGGEFAGEIVLTAAAALLRGLACACTGDRSEALAALTMNVANRAASMLNDEGLL